MSLAPIIREYNQSDLEAVVSLFQRSVREVACDDYSPAQISAWAPEKPDMEAWAQRLATGGVFVAEQEGMTAGFARIDETGHVDALYVHPEAQRGGVATALIQAVLSWAVERGMRRLYSDASITARPFFERSGFCLLAKQTVERRGIELQNFRMAREVDAPPQPPRRAR